MVITPRNLVKHELIGFTVEVTESTDPGKKGIHGKIVDETKNTFVILSKGKEVIVPKAECTFCFTLGNGKVEIDGKKLDKRPEERIKIDLEK